jgi:hypothetical protein
VKFYFCKIIKYLCQGLLADLAVALSAQRSQHDHDGVVSRRRLDIVFELVDVETNDGFL